MSEDAHQKLEMKSLESIRDCDIRVGDTVLVEQRKLGKLSTPYHPVHLTVTSKNHSMLRANARKNQRNRGHGSKFNFAHTLSVGRPRSHTHDKEVCLLKFSLVWEKST